MLQELIKVNSTPAIINVNFDELKSSLKKELERYEILVTAETLADAKKLATELNKTKKVIDDRRKQEVAAASEPVKKFDDEMKELVKMCSDGREAITKQVKRFEDETKKMAEELLGKARDFLREKHGIDAEFFKAEFDDLIKISALTTTGKLTKSAKDDLTYRVLEEKRVQDQTEMRLLNLENQSYKAGLVAPLTRDHVNTFLFDDEATYSSEVARIIVAELDRQEQAEARIRQQMEADQRRKDEAAERERQNAERQRIAGEQAKQAEIDAAARAAQQAAVDVPKDIPAETAEAVEQEATTEPASEPVAAKETTSAPAARSAEKDAVTVTTVFGIHVDPRVSSEDIEKELRRMMAKAGINSLESVHVERVAAKVAA